MELFLQQVLSGLMIGSTYAVVALGFSLVFSVMRVVNMAHPEFFMAGPSARKLGALRVLGGRAAHPPALEGDRASAGPLRDPLTFEKPGGDDQVPARAEASVATPRRLVDALPVAVGP